MLIGLGLGLGVGVEVVLLRDLVLQGGAEVGDHHVAADPGLHRGVHGADRGVPVHLPGALRVPAAHACGPHDGVQRLVPEQRGDLIGGQVHDVADHGLGPGLLDVGDLLLLADDGPDPVTLLDQQGCRQQGDLAVSADDADGAHGVLLVCGPPRGIRHPGASRGFPLFAACHPVQRGRPGPLFRASRGAEQARRLPLLPPSPSRDPAHRFPESPDSGTDAPARGAVGADERRAGPGGVW
ncbi:Uncharacterised protein [Mycobacteroides abscessus subsp. abscessus]|nr:Uncharacterised protein [Mycobacteroides abscessus subsp. abscessus]